MKRTKVVTVAVSCVLLLHSTSFATDPATDPASTDPNAITPWHWHNMGGEVDLWVWSPSYKADILHDATRNARDQWNYLVSNGSPWAGPTFRFRGYTTSTYIQNAVIVAMYNPGVYLSPGTCTQTLTPNSTVGRYCNYPDPDTHIGAMQLVVVFSNLQEPPGILAKTKAECLALPVGSRQTNLWQALLHEEGHSLGLGHSHHSGVNQLMANFGSTNCMGWDDMSTYTWHLLMYNRLYAHYD